MSSAAIQKKFHGTVRGSTIAFDEDLHLDGKRVTVTLVVEDSEPMTAREHATAWAKWVESGEQGPISDEDDERGFP